VDREWTANSPYIDGRTFAERSITPLTDDQLLSRSTGHRLRSIGHQGNLVKVAIFGPDGSMREMNFQGEAFDLISLLGRAFFGVGLCYELGLTREETNRLSSWLGMCTLFDELSDRIATGFELDLEPIAKWAVRARVMGTDAGHPHNPFRLTDAQLLAANEGKMFWAMPPDDFPGTGPVYVEVNGHNRELPMALSGSGRELSSGFGWGYSGTGSFALSASLLKELGLGCREALHAATTLRIAEKLDKGSWSLSGKFLVEQVVQFRKGLETAPRSTFARPLAF
jgi:hypothetical protein